VQVEIISDVFIIYLMKSLSLYFNTSMKNSWPSRSQNQEIQPPEPDPSLSSLFAWALPPAPTIPLIF